MNRLSIAALLLLVACNSQPTVTAQNASVAEVPAKTNDAIKLQPGEWSTTVETLDFEMPGITDPGMKKTIGDSMKATQAKTFASCITKEQAEKPSTEMFAGRNNGECRYTNFKMGSGVIDATMTCAKKGDPGSMTMSMTGNYTPTAYEMTADMKMTNAQMPGGAMTMKVRTEATRTGECKTGNKEKTS